MNHIYFIAFIISIVISLNYRYIEEALLRNNHNKYLHKVVYIFLYYSLVGISSLVIYIIILYSIPKSSYPNIFLWILLYPGILILYGVIQRVKNIQYSKCIWDMLLFTNWLIFYTFFIKCYTQKGESEDVDLNIFLFTIIYGILGISIQLILKKHIGIYSVLGILIGFHLYLRSSGYIFNISHLDYL